ncbi:hypothetical protein NC653_017481 [Populus alba x Populus x berolinensis]|uniref:Uncharacterized protein n=1 Tax=Populus alba x Populus x berolinensis TaxID=444605 RepID=A0AAD6QQC8_9ROSI|nr:hypothetical protein NC653_017481 [Populus alba x Populus x berolinensis]
MINDWSPFAEDRSPGCGGTVAGRLCLFRARSPSCGGTVAGSLGLLLYFDLFARRYFVDINSKAVGSLVQAVLCPHMLLILA